MLLRRSLGGATREGGHRMPITEQGWEIHVQRLKEQTRGNQTRTVGTYQVFHNGEPASAISVDGVAVPLFGTTAESKGPGQNDTPASVARPSRILAGRYPLKTSGGPTYVTTGFRQDLKIKPQMPGIELRKTGNRSAIIIHPGKDQFLSSIGCINLCTSLPDEDEDIDYAGSRRRAIALIEDMKRFLGTVSETGDVAIINAFAIIDGEPMATTEMMSLSALSDGGTIDGRAIAALHGVGVKSDAVKISSGKGPRPAEAGDHLRQRQQPQARLTALQEPGARLPRQQHPDRQGQDARGGGREDRRQGLRRAARNLRRGGEQPPPRRVRSGLSAASPPASSGRVCGASVFS
jgi:hypothetical protein